MDIVPTEASGSLLRFLQLSFAFQGEEADALAWYAANSP